MGEIIMQIAAGNDQEPTWGTRRLGSPADGSGGRRQEGSGRERNRASALLNWASQGQRRGRCSEAAGLAGEPSGQGEEPPPQGLGGYYLETDGAVQRARL